jgi:hypothetical protein
LLQNGQLARRGIPCPDYSYRAEPPQHGTRGWHCWELENGRTIVGAVVIAYCDGSGHHLSALREEQSGSTTQLLAIVKNPGMGLPIVCHEAPVQSRT